MDSKYLWNCLACPRADAAEGKYEKPPNTKLHLNDRLQARNELNGLWFEMNCFGERLILKSDNDFAGPYFAQKAVICYARKEYYS